MVTEPVRDAANDSLPQTVLYDGAGPRTGLAPVTRHAACAPTARGAHAATRS
jgi:hypothetical protein